jgi:predicted anti-sigma-YlaC factor YlaD
MTCKEAVEFLADYLDGNLPWRERLAFDLHLMICRNCRAYLESYSHTIQLIRGFKLVPTGASLPPIPEDLLLAILAARTQRQNPISTDEASGF